MALMNCPECGGQVSDKAGSCPHCGCQVAPAMPADAVDVLLTGKTLPNADIDQAAAAFAKMGGIAPEQARALITGGKPKTLWRGLSPEKGRAAVSRFASMGIEAIMRPGAPERETPRQQPAAPQPARPAQTARPQQTPPEPQMQADTSGATYGEEDYYRAAIGKKADYYLEKFNKIFKWTFTGHLAAFFVLSPWLLYRKMYRNYFLYIFIAVPIQAVVAFGLLLLMMKAGMIRDESTAKGAEILAGLPLALVFMGIANALYKQHIEKKIQEAKALCATPEETVAHLERVGGTNVVACVIGCIVGFLFMAAVSVFSKVVEDIQVNQPTASRQTTAPPVAQTPSAPPVQQTAPPVAAPPVAPQATPKNNLQSLKARAAQGDAEAQFQLGEMHRYGQGMQKDDHQAVEWYRKAADQGHAIAQNNLGVMYDQGQGVVQNYRQAVEWYRKAAAQGYAAAQYNLGVKYDQGQGVAQDYRQAVEWYRKAAAQGYAAAQYNLGVMYDQGQGVAQDYRQAVEWYRKAAVQGYVAAQHNLGGKYDQGQGVAQDYRQAVGWYRKAAVQGHESAQYNLGVMYYQGQGVAQDYQQAVEWFRKAAAQGHAVAQYNLGVMYGTGQGVAQDYRQAEEWVRKAAAQGHEGAKQQLRKLGLQ